MSFFSFFRPKAELGLVFHIGTASIGAGLVKFKKGDVPHVVYDTRESIPYQEDIDPDRFLAGMLDALKIVDARLAREGLAHLKFTEFGSLSIKRVFYIFSSPWAVTQTKVASIREKEPFVLTKDRVDLLVDSHEKAFQAEIAGDGGESALKGLKEIERRVIDIRLNGYSVAEPYGKKTRAADVSFLTSLMPESLYEKIVDISTRAYHPRDTRAFSFALASFTAIRDAFHEESDFIFLDIGGDISDVTVVESGLIAETASFPLGRHFIVRKVAKELRASVEEAASLVRLYEEGRADKALEQKLRPVVDKAVEEWMAGFHGVLGKARSGTSLPTKLFAVINNDLVQLFMRALRMEKISEFGVSQAPLSVSLVNHDRLKQFVAFEKHADKDPFIAIIAAFVGRI